MIGGHDIIVPTHGDSAALDACLRVIRQYWPEAVFENAANGSGANRYEAFSLGDSKEVFAYRDSAAAHEWDAKGADPTLCNTMIHVLQSDGAVTLVVDDPGDAAMAEMLQAVRSALQADSPNGNGQGAMTEVNRAGI